MPSRSDIERFWRAIGTNDEEFLEKWNEKNNMKNINSQLSEILKLMGKNQMRLESFLSNILETEMITQDQYDKILNLLIEYGKKKGWK